MAPQSPERHKKHEPHHEKDVVQKKFNFRQWIKGLFEPLAFWTMLLTIATFFLYREATTQGKISVKALDLAQQNYNAENQPLFALADVRFDSVQVGRPLRVWYHIVNWGRSPAFMTNHDFVL